jgi:putative transposase
MTTPLRIEAPPGIYHLTARGNNRQPIYLDEIDRRTFVSMLGRVAKKHAWAVLAYCLMGNHYHLIARVPLGGLSGALDELNGGYARCTNRRHGRTGHLFGRRFHSMSIERDAHLLEACRYVVLNPVRAALCAEPGAWPWSSYRACAGLDFAPSFLAVDELLRLFGEDPLRAGASYRGFVSSGQASVAATLAEV